MWNKSIIMRILKRSYNVDSSITEIIEMGSTFYTNMYNANSVMYHEPRHEL